MNRYTAEVFRIGAGNNTMIDRRTLTGATVSELMEYWQMLKDENDLTLWHCWAFGTMTDRMEAAQNV